MFTRAITFFSTLVFVSAVQAHDFKLGDIQIDHPFARASMPGQTSAGAYFGLENNGKTNDRLVKVESGNASSVEIHSMELTNNVMKMREVGSIDLSAGSKISMKPGGGYHIMLIGLAHQLKKGEQFPLTLYFEKAGKIEVSVHVEANGQADSTAKHDH